VSVLSKDRGGIFLKFGQLRRGDETVKVQRPGTVQSHFRMGGYHNHAAVLLMVSNGLFQGGDGVTIESYCGLVEKPQISRGG
jgi:hypothetical protein